MINTCPRCGERVKGVMKTCGECQRQIDLPKELGVEPNPNPQASAWSCP